MLFKSKINSDSRFMHLVFMHIIFTCIYMYKVHESRYVTQSTEVHYVPMLTSCLVIKSSMF